MRTGFTVAATIVCVLIASPAQSADLDFDSDISGFLRSSNAKLRAQAESHLRRLAGQAKGRLVGPNFDPQQAVSRTLANTSKNVRVWRNADVRVAANGDVSLVRRQNQRSASRRETERDAQPRRVEPTGRDRRVTRQADHFLAGRMAEIDETRGRALVNGDIQALLRAQSLESQLRAEHRSRFELDGDEQR